MHFNDCLSINAITSLKNHKHNTSLFQPSHSILESCF